MHEIFNKIGEQQSWQVKRVSKVHGGDINEAFCIETTAGEFFIKLNDIKHRAQLFEKEAIGLAALQKHFPLKIPAVIAVGQIAETQYLILEWLQQTSATANSEQQFGTALAQLHQTTNEYFGWPEESYIASIPQTNGWYGSWPEFYAEKRIMPLVKRLNDGKIFTTNDVQNAEQLCSRFSAVMPEELPTLLHGDLWSGNAMAVTVNNQTTTAIYDPNVFYGHREIDIAMTRLFGGFSAGFYAAYQETYPLQSGWQQRLPLFQLSPLLVHALLFGGGYLRRAREIINNE